MRGLACNNCPQPRLGAAPSWWDNISNEVSTDAENVWNDVEAAGVWAGNTAVAPFQYVGQTIDQAKQEISDFGTRIENDVKEGGILLFLMVLGGGLLFMALEEEKK